MYFIIGANPFETVFENNLEMFNESIVLIISAIQLVIF